MQFNALRNCPLVCVRGCKRLARSSTFHNLQHRLPFTMVAKTEQTPALSQSSARKRSNVQQSIAAAFQAAKRPHTNTSNAGKAGISGQRADVDVPQEVDQMTIKLEHDHLATGPAGGPSTAISDQQPGRTPQRLQHTIDHLAADVQAETTDRRTASAVPSPITTPCGPETSPQRTGTQPKQSGAAEQQVTQEPSAAAAAEAGATAAEAAEAAEAGTNVTKRAGSKPRKPQPPRKVARNTGPKPHKPAAAAATAAAAGGGDAGPTGAQHDDAAVTGGSAAAAAAGDGDGDDIEVEEAAENVEAGFTAVEVNQIQTALLGWYDRVCRTLPWRRNPHKITLSVTSQTNKPPPPAVAARVDDSSSRKKAKKPTKQELVAVEAAAVLAAAKPASADLSPQEFAYHVWVSEIMLQQTQVARVITYFNNWISRWPTVTALAAANQEQVNEVWAGLGYYRRAKYLLDGAQFIVNKLEGRFPETATELRKIPGVGPYTAAAIGSIAFSDAAAAVDGNVIRVLARLRAVKGNPAANQMVKVWDKLAAQLLHSDRPGCHNQAMMELGATVCKPQNPTCDSCPVSSWCTAYKRVQQYSSSGGCPDVEEAPRVTDYPEKVTKAAKRDENVAVCVLKVLLLPGADTAAALETAATAAAAAAAAGGGAAAAAAAAKGSKPSGNIRSFFKPKNNSTQDVKPSAAATEQQQQQLSEADLIAAGAAAYYLLVQRPATGLLAGLWEFPGVLIDSEPTPTTRRAAVDTYLTHNLSINLPGSSGNSSGSSSSKRSKGADITPPTAAAAAAVRVVHRRQLGSSVHIFSHIKQTNHAEELVLLATSLDAVSAAAAAADSSSSSSTAQLAAAAADQESKEVSGGVETATAAAAALEGSVSVTKGKKRAAAAAAAAAAEVPAMRWVSDKEIIQQGLTGGVRKILNLALK